ncbi:MAG: hypothetical protein AAGD25_05105 [Cyanobacteria bacterium P01_F01_bin.150]
MRSLFRGVVGSTAVVEFGKRSLLVLERDRFVASYDGRGVAGWWIGEGRSLTCGVLRAIAG